MTSVDAYYRDMTAILNTIIIGIITTLYVVYHNEIDVYVSSSWINLMVMVLILRTILYLANIIYQYYKHPDDDINTTDVTIAQPIFNCKIIRTEGAHKYVDIYISSIKDIIDANIHYIPIDSEMVIGYRPFIMKSNTKTISINAMNVYYTWPQRYNQPSIGLSYSMVYYNPISMAYILYNSVDIIKPSMVINSMVVMNKIHKYRHNHDTYMLPKITIGPFDMSLSDDDLRSINVTNTSSNTMMSIKDESGG